MKTIKILALVGVLSCLLSATRQAAPSLVGAWRLVDASNGLTAVYVVSDNYLIGTYYEANRFAGTSGGTYQTDGKQLKIKLEFDTEDSSMVGNTETYSIALKGNQLTVQNSDGSQVYERIDQPSAQTPMAGLWRITGNIDDNGQVKTRPRTARKTLKLLTGRRFQWVAINPETKQFSGTGGGTYTFKDGKYTETIEFFSRDNSRVGRSLTFSGELNGDAWYHRGQSSTGGKVSEVWSREK
jgi:hypothetical protein